MVAMCQQLLSSEPFVLPFLEAEIEAADFWREGLWKEVSEENRTGQGEARQG